VDAWDYSGKSLTFLRRLHREAAHLWPDTRLSTDRKDLRHLDSSSEKGGYDLVLSSYALNECWESLEDAGRAETVSLLGNLLKESGHLLLIEPAEGDVCRTLHGASAAAVDRNERLWIQAPYFAGMPCPLWNNKSKYFSHEVRPCVPPRQVEQINHPLNLEIREVKFGLSILSRTAPSEASGSGRICRIISPVRKRKGTITLWGIDQNGEEREYEWQRRNLPKEEQKFLLQLQRGDIIALGELPDTDEFRVRLENAGQVRPLFAPRWREND